MKQTETRPQRRASNIIIGFAFVFSGLVWLAFILFMMGDVIADWQEAHPSEFGATAPFTWRDNLQHIGGISGAVTGFGPPTILLGYGLYLLFHRCEARRGSGSVP